MSQLDAWLTGNFQITRADLLINVERLARNASRYSKEHTLPPEKMKADLFFGGKAAVERFVENWIGESQRSAEEDKAGVYRQGEDMQVANAIAQLHRVLAALGDRAPLSEFSWNQIPSEVRRFFCRALQKEMSSSLRKIGKVDLIGGANIYTDEDLTRILMAEFE